MGKDLYLKYANDNKTTTVKYGENEVPYISFDILEKTGLVLNGFSTREGGVSKEHLSTMNLGFSRGDLESNVLENHKIISEAIGFDYKNIVTTNQTHTTNVRIVTEKDKGKGIITPRDYSDVDGLITNVRNLPLATYYADCVPLYFLDTKNKVIGLSHSGWKGTVNKIALVTVNIMKENFGTDSKDVIACIGPSICQSCYEISDDVAKEFMVAFKGHEKEILIDKGNEKYQLDLWKANVLNFVESGIELSNIAVTDICTCCNKDILFSHRGLKGMRGNLAAFLMLK